MSRRLNGGGSVDAWYSTTASWHADLQVKLYHQQRGKVGLQVPLLPFIQCETGFLGSGVSKADGGPALHLKYDALAILWSFMSIILDHVEIGSAPSSAWPPL